MAEEKQANITIEVAPDGIHVHTEYVGTLASIPSVIERLKQAGLVELVSAAAVKTNGNGNSKAAPAKRVDPAYDNDGTPLCPTHRKPLKEGQYGLYCSAKAKPDEPQNDKGYCSLRFN